MNLSCILFTAVQALTKDMLNNRGVHIYEFVFFRSLFNMISSAIIIKHAKVPFFADIKPELRCTLFWRCLLGTISFMILTVAIKYIPLGIFFIIFNSSPFFIAILSFCWTGDRILILEGVAMVGAFAGIICVGLAEPEKEVDDSDANSAETEPSPVQINLKHAY